MTNANLLNFGKCWHRRRLHGDTLEKTHFLRHNQVKSIIWPQRIGVRATGAGGVAAPKTQEAKPLFFGQNLTFSGRSQQQKMKEDIFLYSLNEKTEFIPSTEIKCPKCRIFTNNYWVH